MRTSRLHDLGFIGFGAALYALLGWLSLRLALNQANASAVWPLAGLGIGILGRFGLRYWPLVFIGAFVTNGLVSVQNGAPFFAAAIAAAGIAIGNSAEALIGAWLVRYALGKRPELSSVEGVFRFVILATLVPPLVSAGCGVLSLQFADILPASLAKGTALTWYTGNVAGILTFAPIFLIDSFWSSRWKASRRTFLEGLILMICLAIVGQAISGTGFAAIFPMWPRSYMAIPFVLWIACRFGRQGNVVAMLLLMGFGVAGTMRGYAAFPSDSAEEALISLQLFISVVAVIGLTVSVLVHELRLQRKALESALADKSVRLAAVTRENTILTASAVHELQSPLSGMRNLLRLVQGKRDVFAGPEGGELLSEMQTAVEQMFSLVTGALSVSRPDSGDRGVGVRSNCCLNDLLQRVIGFEQTHADSKGIRIRLSMPVGPVMIETEASVLEHIVHNFLSNAVKFSKPGASVFVDLEQTGKEVVISVTDQGPGIAERDRAGIFSGRFRHHGARPTGGETSSGMGLYLVGELAVRLGARVACEASTTGGSVFVVEIPLGVR
jgi:signal transduction histidine kinase